MLGLWYRQWAQINSLISLWNGATEAQEDVFIKCSAYEEWYSDFLCRSRVIIDPDGDEGSMRSLKSVFGVGSAVVPVLYCGGLLYYFLDLSGSVQQATEIGLGPTVLGLGVVGLLFSIPLILKVVRILARPRPPGSGGPDAPAGDDGFDADAAIARYMAQRSAEGVPHSPAAPSAPAGGGTTRRASFGRKTG